MKINFQEGGVENWRAQAIALFLCEDENFAETIAPLATRFPWLANNPALADFRGKKSEISVIYGPDESSPRVVALGLGKLADVAPASLRTASAAAAQKCRALGVESVLIPVFSIARFPGGRDRLIEDCAVGALLGLYKFTELKTRGADERKEPESLSFGLDGDATEGARLAIKRAESAARAARECRDLANLPGNILYPETFALKANALAQERGFDCRILDHLALAEADMGCLLAVGSGSSHPPRLVCIEYAAEDHKEDKPLVLAGKGVTFDSGGLCLKPAANMWQMKCDMTGAAVVLSVIAALAREKAPTRVVGVMPCAENMPDGGAFRPGDVVIAANGESVEIINTDAEGRLILCDALAWAQKQWTPAAIIDIATLTGACAVALGNDLAGLFCDDADLSAKIAAYGKTAGENFWRMPLWSPYAKELESEIADIKHTGSREGGAIIAALFLKHFIKPGTPWAHLDIAGVDWQAKASPLCPVGATGFGVRTLLALARGGWQ